MKKHLPLFLVAMFLVCFFSSARTAAQYEQSANTITCESRHHRLQYCPVSDPRSVVVLVQQLGREQCVRGETWGNDERGVWVDKGCRAQFRIEPRGGGPGWWNSGRGQRSEGQPRSGACFFKEPNFRGDYF